MHPVSNDEEATLPVPNRELRIRIFGAGENSYALLCLLALLEILVEQASKASIEMLTHAGITK